MTDILKRTDSAFYRIERQGGTRLLIVFSHVDMPIFKFAQSKVFESLKCDKLFVNCPNNDYYINGVPGMGGSFFETLLALDRFIRNGRYEDVTFFGNSMGAYGALNYGLELGGRIISLAPEVLLGISGGASSQKMHNRSLKKGQLQLLIDRFNLFYAKAVQQIYIIFGESDFADVVCAEYLLKRFSLPVYAIKNGPHSLAPYIEKNIGLRNMVWELMNDSARSLDQSSLFQNRFLVKFGYDTYIRSKARVLDSIDRSAFKDNEHFAHIFLRNLVLAKKRTSVDDLTLRSNSLSYHNAQFLYDSTRWADIVDRDDIFETARRYANNSTLGDYHFFLKKSLENGLIEIADLSKIGLPSPVVEAIQRNAS